MSDKIELELKKKQDPLRLKLASGSIATIPRDAIRTVTSLPENAVPGQVVALVSEDEGLSVGFYIAQETDDGAVQWELFLTATGITEVPDYSITSRKIKSLAVNTVHLAHGAVDSDILKALSVKSGHIQDKAVGTSKLQDKAVTPEKLDREYATPEDVENAISNIEIPDMKIAEDSIGTEHLQDFAVTGDKIAYSTIKSYHLEKESVTTDRLSNKSVTDAKIKDKTITQGKLAFDAATEDFVRNTVKNAVSAEPLIKDAVTVLDDFEGYEVHQVIKTTDKIEKEWEKVKIWSASDGITAGSTNPTEFDFSQISETNYTKTVGIPSTVDLSSVEGRNIICSLIFQDEEVKKFIVIQLLQPTGTNPSFNIMFYSGEENKMDQLIYSTENGWMQDGKILSDSDLLKFSITYPSLKIVDFASLHKDNPEVAPEGVETSPEILIDLFLKDMMTVYYPPGYYLTEDANEYATKEDVNSILDSFASMLDAMNREVI